MSKIVILCVFASFLAITLAASTTVSIAPQPPNTNTTTAPPDTTTPTTTPSTTTSTTTVTPDTTTPTTTSSTTPSTTSATTTTAPSTTSVAPSTTTPPPAPKPAEVGNWTVTDKADNVTCIIAKMAIQLNVTYLQIDNKTGYSLINVPAKTATATGDCGNKTQTLVLSWAAAGVAKLQHQITLTFGRNDTVKESKVERIDVVLQANSTEFPKIGNLTVLTLVNQQTEFTTEFGMSYSCAKNQMLDLTKKDSNATAAVITVSQLRLESFHAKNDTAFSTAKDCESSNATDIVPIAVGCALVALVAIVLIAYLIGRRRSQARGYLSIDDHDHSAHS